MNKKHKINIKQKYLCNETLSLVFTDDDTQGEDYDEGEVYLFEIDENGDMISERGMIIPKKYHKHFDKVVTEINDFGETIGEYCDE